MPTSIIMQKMTQTGDDSVFTSRLQYRPLRLGDTLRAIVVVELLLWSDYCCGRAIVVVVRTPSWDRCCIRRGAHDNIESLSDTCCHDNEPLLPDVRLVVNCESIVNAFNCFVEAFCAVSSLPVVLRLGLHVCTV